MKLMILDGNSIINRAFYGVRLLSTKDGVYTNAIYGFLNILERLRADEQPDALCVAFDLKAPTFRHLAYDGYKATRHPMPEELAMQMPLMKEVLGAMNIPIYECEGWEADDILGTAGEICAREGADCVIVTGDRDSLQLVTDRVTVKLVTSKSGQTITTNYTPDVFRAEYGLDLLLRLWRLLRRVQAVAGNQARKLELVEQRVKRIVVGLPHKISLRDEIYRRVFADGCQVIGQIRLLAVFLQFFAHGFLDLRQVLVNAVQRSVFQKQARAPC